MHQKVPAWFGVEPRGKGPAQQAPRRVAYPVRWGAAWCFFDEGEQAAETWVGKQATRILQGHARQVARAIARKAAVLERNRRSKADDAVTYLRNKAPYLDYPTALASGWPIATGVIEGAVRHLVVDRLDITGARWGLDGAEAILKLRALTTNGDFDAYWTHHLAQEHQRIHHSRYAPHVLAQTGIHRKSTALGCSPTRKVPSDLGQCGCSTYRRPQFRKAPSR